MFWLMFPKMDARSQTRESKLLDLEQRMDAFLNSRPRDADHDLQDAVRHQRAAVQAELASRKQWH